MKKHLSGPPAQPFFLGADVGERFCLYHLPHPDKKCRGGFIYVHPFGDEMNKARRMAAMQARTFAAMGFAVLQMDLFGCGDSSGELADARWDIWKRDLTIAKNWLEDRITASVSLWGLRLGALLALDFARGLENTIDQVILWQPITNGETFLTQFLRFRLANEMLAGMEKTAGTNTLRHHLANGETIEIAGYGLAPELAAVIDSLKAAELVVAKSPVHWFEIVPEPSRTMTPAAAKVANEWKQNEVDLHLHFVPGLPFWATQEITECVELLSATENIFAEESA
jgi:exosortase A-associated hydrolase 2